jgi:hypothetical protein
MSCHGIKPTEGLPAESNTACSTPENYGYRGDLIMYMVQNVPSASIRR